MKTIEQLKDFNKAIKEEWEQLKKDFTAVYGKEPRNVAYHYWKAKNSGYFTFEIGNDMFPTHFRGCNRGCLSCVDPYTEEGFVIMDGKVISNKASNWYQEAE